MGQFFVEIDWKEMEDIFLPRGYREHVPRGWKEISFVKMDRSANLAVVIATSFDLDYYLRDVGQDAIRGMLATIDPPKLPVLTLKGVKRINTWRSRIEEQADLLEELVIESPACPFCGCCTIPKMRRDHSDAFWGCGRYEYDHCKGTRPMLPQLADRLLNQVRAPRSY